MWINARDLAGKAAGRPEDVTGKDSLPADDTGIAPPDFLKPVNNDDAAPDSTATTNEMAVGETFKGTLDRRGDTDWIRIRLEKGDSIKIAMVGDGRGGVDDPLVKIYDARGRLLGTNDDGGVGLNALLKFTASSSGAFYIVADSFRSRGTGDYKITVSKDEPKEPPKFNVLDTIDWGTKVSGEVVKVFFAPAGHRADGIRSEGWKPYEKKQFGKAFDRIEKVADIRFKEIDNAKNADFVLLLDTNGELGGALGYFKPPGERNAGVGVFNGAQWDRRPGGDLEEGGFGFVTIMHEVLHGLGLAHPHDRGGGSARMPQLSSAFGDPGPYDLNQGIYTTMSYNSGAIAGPVGTPGARNGNFGYEAGPMALDIAVLQKKYGPNNSTNRGDNVYTLPDSKSKGTMWTTIWDKGGTDLIRHSGHRDATIDLRPATLDDGVGGGGYPSAARGIPGGFTIAKGVRIENASGGQGDDGITGNNSANRLKGNGGRDTIKGGAGDDRIDGNGKRDLLFGGKDRDVIKGGEGGDRLFGGDNRDTLRGQDGNDRLFGGKSNDWAGGGRGSDKIDGGQGRDRLQGGGGKDSLAGEGGDDVLRGGPGNDLLFGGGGRDNVNGRQGNDKIFGGHGNDKLTGGLGDDTFIFIRNHGRDVVRDFKARDNGEKIDLSAIRSIDNFPDLRDAAVRKGRDVLIDTGPGDSILLKDVALADLGPGDFIF